MYQPRTYRNLINPKNLITFKVCYKETDLLISASKDLKDISYKLLKKYYIEIKNYINKNPKWAKALSPIEVKDEVTEIIKKMNKASNLANVGPMAAVAGAIAEFVGKKLTNYVEEIIIENGGDIFIKTKISRTILIYAGKSPLSNKIGIKIKPTLSLGICTSSATVGHSLSFGKADAVTIIAESAAIADAYATSFCNQVKSKKDIEKITKEIKNHPLILGIVIIKDDKLGVWGNIELVRI
jgi:hypothetical protein